jgi:hypothetical protein
MICGHCKAADVDIPHVKACGHTPGADNYLDAVGAPSWDSIVATRALHPVSEIGVYKHEGDFYRVREGRSGYLYAELIVVDPSGVSFEYSKGTIRKLYAEDRITLTEAAEFGRCFGACCVCGRTLTNPDSIEAGIGPICAGRL